MKRTENDSLYRKLMEARRKDPKSYGLSCIGVAYEDLRNYAKSKKCVLEELGFLAERFRSRMSEVVSVYSLSRDDVREYFARNNYSQSFLGSLDF